MNMPGERKPDYDRKYGMMLNTVKFVLIALVIVLVIFLIIFFSQRAYSLGYESATYEPVNSESEAVEIEVTITAQMSASDIGELLIEKGLIEESLQAFLLQDALSGLHGEYVPGAYTLNTSMTVDEMLQTICPDPEEEE